MGTGARRYLIVGVAVVAGIILQSHALLTWLNFIFLILALTLLELFLISLRRDAHRLPSADYPSESSGSSR